MPAGTRWRQAARIALALLAGVLLVPAAQVSGRAADQPLAVSVHLGYHDTVKSGQWMPVTIDISNSGSDFQGTLEVALQDNQNSLSKGPFAPGGQDSAVYDMPISVPAGGTKHVRTFLVSDFAGLPVTVRVLRANRVLLTTSATAATTANLLVGVLSDESSTFDDFGALHFANVTPQVVHLQREEIPDTAVLLRGFDLIAIDDFATDTLTAAQRNALGDYVAEGGNLLLGAGAAWRKTTAGLPPALLPMQVSGTATVSGNGILPGASPIEVATGTLSGGRSFLSAGSTPLLVEKLLGNGIVTQSTFDWAQDPIAGWTGARDLLRQVAVRDFYGSSQSQSVPYGIGGGGPFIGIGVGGGTSITQRSNFLMSALSNLPALDLPSLRQTGLLVLLYVLVVGPLNYFGLRALGRRELAWLTVPAIAIVFAAGAYGLGVGTKGRSVQSNQISIVHIAAGWNRAYRETYTGVFTPTRGDYAVTLQGDRSTIAPIATVYGGPGPIQGGIRIRPDDNALDLLGVTAFTLRGFATESTVTAPQLTATVRLSNGQLVGTLHNGSSRRFDGAVVIAGDASQVIGALAPGADATFAVTPHAASPFNGPPAVLRIYPNTMFGPPPAGTPSAAEREGEQRSQILQLLLGGYKGLMSTQVQPMVVAWTSLPMQDIKVNGGAPTAHAENAIILPLPVADLPAGALPAGLVAPRLVDATGQVQPNVGGVGVQDGSVTYEFAVPAAPGVRLTNATLTDTNPYGPKFVPAAPAGGAQQQGSFDTSAWDWSTGSWMPIALADNNSVPLPDSAFERGTGTVRVRIQSVSGDAFQLGQLQLAGTLQ